METKQLSEKVLKYQDAVLYMTLAKYKLLMSKGADGKVAVTIFFHMMFTAVLQETTSVYITNTYLKNGVKYGQKKIIAALKILTEVGLITPKTKSSKTYYQIKADVSKTVKDFKSDNKNIAITVAEYYVLTIQNTSNNNYTNYILHLIYSSINNNNSLILATTEYMSEGLNICTKKVNGTRADLIKANYLEHIIIRNEKNKIAAHTYKLNLTILPKVDEDAHIFIERQASRDQQGLFPLDLFPLGLFQHSNIKHGKSERQILYTNNINTNTNNINTNTNKINTSQQKKTSCEDHKDLVNKKKDYSDIYNNRIKESSILVLESSAPDNTRLTQKNTFVAPSREQVISYGSEYNMSEVLVNNFLDKMEKSKWKTVSGDIVRNWKAYLKTIHKSGTLLDACRIPSEDEFFDYLQKAGVDDKVSEALYKQFSSSDWSGADGIPITAWREYALATHSNNQKRLQNTEPTDNYSKNVVPIITGKITDIFTDNEIFKNYKYKCTACGTTDFYGLNARCPKCQAFLDYSPINKGLEEGTLGVGLQVVQNV